MPAISTILFFEWLAALLVAIWALRVAQVFSSRMPRVAARPLDKVAARVAVILPVKGVEEDTAGNIEALLKQDYANYRLIFAVESESDPVIGLIERLTEQEPLGRVEIIVAGASHTRGQKVHNQLAAVERTDDLDDILMFVDADARPGPSWVQALAVPLTYGSHIGATTGYRYYVPASRTTPNLLASILNAGVAALFGPYRRTFAWGGSMALRRQDFFAYGVHAAWQNAVSDDYALTHCVKKEAGKKIHFVPQCMVASRADFTWGSFLEFAVRQYRITRVCAPQIWLPAVIGPILYLTAFIYTLTFAIWAAVSPAAQLPFLEPVRLGGMFVSLYGLSILRGILLWRGSSRLLPAHAREIQGSWFWFTLGYPFVQMVNLAVLLASALGRKIVWRGVTYVMRSRTETMVSRPAQSSPPVRSGAELAPVGGGR